MRTTLVLRDDLFAKASELAKIAEKTALIHAGLEALIAQCARERLAALGGLDPAVKPVRRRRSKKGVG